MKLIVLGSGTLVPDSKRGSPGYVLTNGEESALIDSGSGTLQRLEKAGVKWTTLTRAFYTHLHPDHCLDMAALFFALNYAPSSERESFTIYGPPGTGQLQKSLAETLPATAPKGFELAVEEIDSGFTFEPAETCMLRATRVDHGKAISLAYRFDCHGKSIVLSGDTQYCDALATLADGADVLVCECSTDDDHAVEGHMTPSQVARVVEEAGVKEVWLTHVYPPFHPAELAEKCSSKCKALVRAADDYDEYKFT